MQNKNICVIFMQIVSSLTLRHETKKSTVNNVPVSGSNFESPNIIRMTKCKNSINKSSDMMMINGAKNSRWSLRNPMMSKIDEMTPSMEHPKNIILNHKLTNVIWYLERKTIIH